MQLLRREDLDRLAKLITEEAPAARIWRSRLRRFELRNDQYSTQSAVDAVRESKVDDAIQPAKRDSGLARSRVRGSSRVPLPPARITVNTPRMFFSGILGVLPLCRRKPREERGLRRFRRTDRLGPTGSTRSGFVTQGLPIVRARGRDGRIVRPFASD